MLKKLLITGGIALAGYVINEVRKQYDKNVNDYNDLADRYNEMSEYIQGNNYYTGKNNRFVTETYDRDDGSKIDVKHDRASGFSVISLKNA